MTAGSGVYSLWLAKLGYEVHLVDIVPRHVDQAREASKLQPGCEIARFHVGDARELSQPDGFAEAVLLLGPLYHLTDRPDRLKALSEARRVLKKGGMIFAAAISRFASLMDGLSRSLIDDEIFRGILHRDLSDGQHRNPTDNLEYFTTAYFHRPEELKDEMSSAGLAVHEVLPVEGPGWISGDFENCWADEEKRRQLLDLIRAVESECSLLGMSPHLLAVGVKE